MGRNNGGGHRPTLEMHEMKAYKEIVASGIVNKNGLDFILKNFDKKQLILYYKHALFTQSKKLNPMEWIEAHRINKQINKESKIKAEIKKQYNLSAETIQKRQELREIKILIKKAKQNKHTQYGYMSFEDIAKVLKIAPSDIRETFYRGLAKIALNLKKKGITLQDLLD